MLKKDRHLLSLEDMNEFMVLSISVEDSEKMFAG